MNIGFFANSLSEIVFACESLLQLCAPEST